MSYFQLMGIALGGTIVAMLLREINKSYSVYVSIITVLILTYFALSNFVPIIEYITQISETKSVGNYISLILRITAIGVFTKITADFCTDIGEKSIAQKVELVGKSTIVIIILPVVRNIVESARNFLL